MFDSWPALGIMINSWRDLRNFDSWGDSRIFDSWGALRITVNSLRALGIMVNSWWGIIINSLWALCTNFDWRVLRTIFNWQDLRSWQALLLIHHRFDCFNKFSMIFFLDSHSFFMNPHSFFIVPLSFFMDPPSFFSVLPDFFAKSMNAFAPLFVFRLNRTVSSTFPFLNCIINVIRHFPYQEIN